MSVADTEVANNVIYRVLENGNADASFTGAAPLMTQMFTTTQIVDAMNRVQQDFLLETGMTLTRTTIAGVVGTPRYNLPISSIRPRRLTWQDASTGQIAILSPVDTWELDNGFNHWPTDRGIPVVWYENELPQQQVGIALTPSNNGTIGLLYVALAAILTGAGIALSIPDDWSPYILYGTLADLLGADGPAFDPVRAQYCTQRFEEGIELAKLVLGG